MFVARNEAEILGALVKDLQTLRNSNIIRSSINSWQRELAETTMKVLRKVPRLNRFLTDIVPTNDLIEALNDEVRRLTGGVSVPPAAKSLKPKVKASTPVWRAKDWTRPNHSLD